MREIKVRESGMREKGEREGSRVGQEKGMREREGCEQGVGVGRERV